MRTRDCEGTVKQRGFKEAKNDVGSIYTLLTRALLVAAATKATYFKAAAAAKTGRTLAYLLFVFRYISPSKTTIRNITLSLAQVKCNVSDYPFPSCTNSLLPAASREQKIVACQISCSPL